MFGMQEFREVADTFHYKLATIVQGIMAQDFMKGICLRTARTSILPCFWVLIRQPENWTFLIPFCSPLKPELTRIYCKCAYMQINSILWNKSVPFILTEEIWPPAQVLGAAQSTCSPPTSHFLRLASCTDSMPSLRSDFQMDGFTDNICFIFWHLIKKWSKQPKLWATTLQPEDAGSFGSSCV